jgi:cellulose biosynthesis protein BcsQ
VPVGPSELDFLGVLPTLQMLRRKDANFRVVLARTWYTETAAMTILRERLQPEGLLFATRIAERVAHKEASRYGQAVTEFDPARRAGEEMTAFYCEVKEALGGFAA